MKEIVEDMPEVDEDSTDTDKSAKPADAKSTGAVKKEIKEDKKKKEKKEELKDDKKKAKSDDEVEVSAEVEEVEVEEEVRKFNPKTEMQISDAKLIKKTVKVGAELRMKLDPPEDYGRMAAQTAKQVIIQRLREAEREMIFADFKEKEHEVVSGVVQRREGKVILVDLGKSVGVLTPEEMIPGEKYGAGDRIKVYVKEVNSRAKGPEIVLSRTSDEILRKIFYLEIPEVSNNLIELKAVAREAGFRSKVAVSTESDNVDPIGSCVGQRGARIQTIISELGGEKVDIILFDEDPVVFIQNALSPAKVISIDINEETKKATVRVAEDQLSLAIGKGGQNARLAAKLTGWKVDIVQEDGSKPTDKKPVVAKAVEDKDKDSVEGSTEEKTKDTSKAEAEAEEAVEEKSDKAELKEAVEEKESKEETKKVEKKKKSKKDEETEEKSKESSDTDKVEKKIVSEDKTEEVKEEKEREVVEEELEVKEEEPEK